MIETGQEQIRGLDRDAGARAFPGIRVHMELG